MSRDPAEACVGCESGWEPPRPTTRMAHPDNLRALDPSPAPDSTTFSAERDSDSDVC